MDLATVMALMSAAKNPANKKGQGVLMTLLTNTKVLSSVILIVLFAIAIFNGILAAAAQSRRS